MSRDIADAKINLCFEHLNIKLIRINHSGAVCPKHSHGKGFYELHYIDGGRGKFICDGTEYPVESGMLIMTGPLIVHEQITDSSDPMSEYCFEFEIREDKRRKPSKEAAVLKETDFWIGADTQNMLQKFLHIESESESRNICYVQAVRSIITEILIDLVRNYSGCSVPQSYAKVTTDDRRILITDEIFLYKYADITLGGLSKRLGLSDRQTQRFLKKAYGKSFIRLRTEKRQEKACELIQSGMSSREAALNVGYEKAQSLEINKKRSKNL